MKNSFSLNDLSEAVAAEDIAGLTVLTLKVHYERELERVQEILRGFDELYYEKLTLLWQSLISRNTSREKAYGTFIRIIEAELDGGNAPMVSPAFNTKPLQH